MELGITYVVLSYVGPVCGIIGFIIMPGLTHIRPWLLEKFNKSRKDFTGDRLLKNYSTMCPVNLFKEKIIFDNSYKFDWRSRIRSRKKELNRIISEISCVNCDKKDKCNKQ